MIWQGFLIIVAIAAVSGLCLRALYNLYLHPLAKFPGPWYAASFSLSGALASWFKFEHQWLQSLVKTYGTDSPIRISPSLLLFPTPSALKLIYWDPVLNEKSGLYRSGALGPPSLFSTLESDVHKTLRKALGGPQWAIGSLKKEWEPRIDDLIQLFIQKMTAKAKLEENVVLCDKVAEFAADFMTMFSFTEPWGFVENGRDERGLLSSWRKGLNFFGLAAKWRFLRDHVITIPVLASWLLPKTSNSSGMGFLMSEAEKQIKRRDEEMEKDVYMSQPDFLQHCLDARIDGKPLSPLQKKAHATLLIQAGADTTGTALGATLRFLTTHPDSKLTASQEIQHADSKGLLSTPVKYEEVRQNLPYFIACIKESMRLQPPATNLFGRVVGEGGKTILGHYIPPGTEITSSSYVVQRDSEYYAPDPNEFRPERWLENDAKALEMDAMSFVFGMGPRVCLGKDIAIMELYKLLPEIIRRFDLELVNEGKYVVAGGIAYNEDFVVKLWKR
jgi:cytochrome P450